MDVDNIGVLFLENASEFAARPRRPKHPRGNDDPVHNGRILQILVAPDVGNHSMAGPFQHTFFALKNDIFAACLAIGVVNHEDFHSRFIPEGSWESTVCATNSAIT
jgi:hypothetical protein